MKASGMPGLSSVSRTSQRIGGMATNREAIGRRLEALSRHSVAAAGGAGGGADAASSPRREVPYGKGDVTWSSGLRYTLNTDVLTRAEREKYERDGFHVRVALRAPRCAAPVLLW